MRSGHRSGHAIPIVGVLALAFLWAHTAHAQSRVVCVRSREPHEAELIERIEGQTRDLPVTLAWVDAHGAASVRELAAVATRHAGDFVVSVQAIARGGHVVYVYDAKQQRVRARKVPQPARGERFSSSATLETVSLIVRGELSAALAGEPSTDVEEPDVDSTAPDQTTAVATPTAPQQDATPKQPAAKAAVPQENTRVELHDDDADDDDDQPAPNLRVAIALGMRAAMPNIDAPLFGPWAGARVELTHFELGLYGSTTWPTRLRDSGVSIGVRRHAIELEALGHFRIAKTLDLAAGAALGLLLYSRTTQTSDPQLAKTPDHTSLSASLGPLAELRWRFAAPVGIAARIGVDFVPQPTLFTYDSVVRSPPTELARFTVYEPWAAIALFVDVWN